MGKYGVHFLNLTTATATFTTGITLAPAATNIMCECVEAEMTGDGATTPADIAHQASLAKTTLAVGGSATTVTAEPMDDASNAARTITKTNYTVEGTVIGTVYPVLFGFNQRGGMRWAVPKGDGMIAYQPLTNKGLAFIVKSSAVGKVGGSMLFFEP